MSNSDEQKPFYFKLKKIFIVENDRKSKSSDYAILSEVYMNSVRLRGIGTPLFEF